jgi:hypothetical protein
MLRKDFRVTDQQRRLKLATQYSSVQKKPKNQSVQAWLDEYSQITPQCVQENMPEMTERRAQGDSFMLYATQEMRHGRKRSFLLWSKERQATFCRHRLSKT